MGRGLTSLNLPMSIFDKFDLNILRYFPLVGEYQRSYTIITVIFRKNFDNETCVSIKTSNKIFILYFILVLATGLLLYHQLPIALSQSVNDPSLNVESLVEGLNSPTSMAFLDSNNIMVLEKDGQVSLVSNGQLQSQPILEILVDTQSERCWYCSREEYEHW
jgi:hypothetical protein